MQERQRLESNSSTQSSITTFWQAGYFHRLNLSPVYFLRNDSKSSCLRLVKEQQKAFLNNQNYRNAVIQQEAVITMFFSKCALVYLNSTLKIDVSPTAM